MDVSDRRAVFSFLNTLYDDNDDRNQKEDRTSGNQRHKSPTSRVSSRVNTAIVRSSNPLLQQRSASNHGRESRASKRDLGDILESLER